MTVHLISGVKINVAAFYKIVVTKVELELLMHEWCQHVSVTPGLLNKVSLHGCRVDMVSFMVH